jgi:hypothetical protein
MNSQLQDPLAILHPNVIEQARHAIATSDAEVLTPEVFTKCQNHLNELIDMSPNKFATACYLVERISKDGFTKIYLTLRNGCILAKTGINSPQRRRNLVLIHSRKDLRP